MCVYVYVCVFRVAVTINNHHFPNTRKILHFIMDTDLTQCEIENGVLYAIYMTSHPSAFFF